MTLPADHPLRVELNDEVHARPPEALEAPVRVSYLALLSPWDAREAERRNVTSLAERLGAEPPPEGVSHYSGDFGAFRLKYERHTEFTRYTIMVAETKNGPDAGPALAAVPADWIGSLQGQVIFASHATLIRADDAPVDPEAIATRYFDGNVLVGAAMSSDAALAFTDFRIHADGFNRLLVQNRSMTPRQAGRIMQRLLEIDTYRVMALLALPVARQLGPLMTAWERELEQITATLVQARDEDEPDLLARLMRLESEIDSRDSATHYRFSAARAYYEIVQRRIAELREQRIQGLQTFQDFTERRLAPAMNTCAAIVERQAALSDRIARTTQLLSTRIDMHRQRQNQALLESMNRRAKLQIRLQQTVEGLSVAAITYYAAGLVGYLAKGAKTAGIAVDPDVAVALSIPIVATLVFLGIRRLRTIVTRSAG